jgi:parallel beta-helix repeat protein
MLKKRLKFIGIFVLASIFLSLSTTQTYGREIARDNVRQYIRQTHNIASHEVTDTILDMVLDEQSKAVNDSFLKIFDVFIKTDEFFRYFNKGMYDEAFGVAAQYAWEEAVGAIFSAAGMASIGYAANAIYSSLVDFYNTTDAIACNNQLKLYIKARKLEEVDHDFILAGNDDMIKMIYFTSDGWLNSVVEDADAITVGGTNPSIKVPDGDRVEFFEEARKVYDAKENSSLYEYEKQEIVNEFKERLYPTIECSPASPSAPVEMSFNVSGQILSDMNIVSYTWDFGNGESANTQNAKVYYKQPNDYIVTLKMTDSAGEIHEYRKIVYVRPPEILVSYPHGYESLKRTFSTPKSDFVNGYSWNFGDGSPPLPVRVKEDYKYDTSDNYLVTLTLELKDGSILTSKRKIFVGPGTIILRDHIVTGDEKFFSGGKYMIYGGIQIEKGANLLIEPNTTVLLDGDSSIYVQGTLRAEDASFAGIDGMSWGGIEIESWDGIDSFDNSSTESYIKNCKIENSSGFGFGVISIWDSSPTIVGCTITNCDSSVGIAVYGNSAPYIVNNYISGITNFAIDVGSDLMPTITGNSLNNNKYGINASSSGIYNSNSFIDNTYGIFLNLTENSTFDISDSLYKGNDFAMKLTGTLNMPMQFKEYKTYLLDNFSVGQNGFLSIPKDCTVKITKDSLIHVSGVLQAEGVLFTKFGADPWSGIEIADDASSESYLKSCQIENATGDILGVISIYDSSPSVIGCTIENCDAYTGIEIGGGSAPTIEDNVVKGLNVGISVGSDLSPTITGNTLSNNEYGVYAGDKGSYQFNSFLNNTFGAFFYLTENAELTIGDNEYQDNEFAMKLTGKLSMPLVWKEGKTYLLDKFSIEQDGKLSIPQDCIVKITKDNGISVNGTLQADGTVFTKEGTEPWGSIEFGSNASTDSYLNSCKIEYASGIGFGVINIWDSSPSIIGCTLDNCGAYTGISINGKSASDIKNNMIMGFKNAGIEVGSNLMPTIIGNTLANNEYGISAWGNGIYQKNVLKNNTYGSSYSLSESGELSISDNEYETNDFAMKLSGKLNTTINWKEGETYLLDDFSIEQSGRLYIPKGCTVKISKNDYISVNGILQAEGAVFTKAGTESWSSIEFGSNASSDSYLNSCKIEYASGIGFGVINIWDSSPSIVGCTFENCESFNGISMSGESTAVIKENAITGFVNAGIEISTSTSPSVFGNTIQDNKYGVYSYGSGKFYNNLIAGNQDYGIFNSSDTIIDAIGNNWGDATGPNDPSDDRRGGGWYNPDGQGDKVSDNINYSPWEGVVLQAGDINGDESVDLLDLIAVLQLCSGIDPDRPVFSDVDVNGDELLDLREAMFIMRKVTK